MADGSSTSPSNETVSLKLPSGEMVDAIVPAGYSDDQVRGLMQSKHPEFFPKTSPPPPPGFFQRHPIVREAALGAMSAVSPETASGSQNVKQIGQGLAKTFEIGPNEIDTEPVGRALSYLPVVGPVYRTGANIGQQLAQYGKEFLSKEPEQVAHGAAGALTTLGTLGLGKEAAADVAEKGIKVPRGPFGLRTIARTAFDNIESKAGGAPVDYRPTLAWAQEAMKLEEKGYTIPKPIKDFISWVENRTQRPSLQPVPGQPKAFTEAPATSFPLTVKDAREFYTAFGEAIPWDQFGGKKGRVFRLFKEMYGSLDQATKDALEPYGLAEDYEGAKANYASAMKWPKAAKVAGRVGGLLTGFHLGREIGHPFMGSGLGAAIGGSLGERAARAAIDLGAKRQPLTLPAPPEP